MGPDLPMPLPVTGSSSYVYETVTGQFATPVTGNHTVYLVFRTTPQEGREYAAKLDWLQFKEKNEDLKALSALAGLMRTALNKADFQRAVLGLFVPLRGSWLAA